MIALRYQHRDWTTRACCRGPPGRDSASLRLRHALSARLSLTVSAPRLSEPAPRSDSESDSEPEPEKRQPLSVRLPLQLRVRRSATRLKRNVEITVMAQKFNSVTLALFMLRHRSKALQPSNAYVLRSSVRSSSFPRD
eukprot:1022480-Rhodomonas_salina.1